MLVDEFWHAVSDEGNGVDWYLKRTVLGGIYSTTEIYMLTDNSPGFFYSLSFVKYGNELMIDDKLIMVLFIPRF
mgnify:CR=1 FL=1